MATKTVEVVTDVPFSMPSTVDVIVDLPAKRFSANPKVVAAVAIVGLGVAGYLAYKGLKLQKAKKKKADAEANAELDDLTKTDPASTETLDD